VPLSKSQLEAKIASLEDEKGLAWARYDMAAWAALELQKWKYSAELMERFPSRPKKASTEERPKVSEGALRKWLTARKENAKSEREDLRAAELELGGQISRDRFREFRRQIIPLSKGRPRKLGLQSRGEKLAAFNSRK
jgi:hypothetical protein